MMRWVWERHDAISLTTAQGVVSLPELLTTTVEGAVVYSCKLVKMLSVEEVRVGG